MPTCISCKGEYYTTDTRCSRCGVDNGGWEAERTHSWIDKARQFFLGGIWGILALISLTLPFIALLLRTSLQPAVAVAVGVPVAVLLCSILFLFTYAMRFSLREYELSHHVLKGRRPGLALMALLAFIMALSMALLVAAAFETLKETSSTAEMVTVPTPTVTVTPIPILSETSSTTELVKVGAIIAFSLIFVNITLSAMFMAVRDFIGRLDAIVPQPIFLREGDLVSLIFRSAREMMGGISLELLEMSRTESGGVKILVKRSSQVTQPSSGEADKWEIEANKWGRSLSIKLAKPKEDKW